MRVYIVAMVINMCLCCCHGYIALIATSNETSQRFHYDEISLLRDMFLRRAAKKLNAWMTSWRNSTAKVERDAIAASSI